MIQVGVNNNVYIGGIAFNDKGSIVISFKEGGKKPMSAYESLMADEHVEQGGGRDLIIFPPLPTTDDKLTEEKKVDRAHRDVNNIKGQFMHFMQGYLSKDDAKIGAVVYEGTGVDNTNFNQKMQNEDTLKLMFTNMGKVFIDKLKPFVGDETRLFRLLLLRQSKDKHYPTLRRSYLDESPIWETMDVSDEMSKVKFTPYEIKEGLNDGTPTDRATADKPSQPAITAEQVFNKGKGMF